MEKKEIRRKIALKKIKLVVLMCVFCLSLSLFPFSSVRQDTFKATQCRCDVRSTPYRFKIEFQTWIFISNFSHQIIIEIMDEMLTSHWMWNVHYILTWQTERLFTVHIQFLDRRGRGKGQTFSLEKKIKWVHVLLILIELDESLEKPHNVSWKIIDLLCDEFE